MRLRHKPWGDVFIVEHPHLIKTSENILDQDLINYLKQDNLCLEIGVGRGNFILNLALKNQDKKYLGVEVSDMALAIAGKKIDQSQVSNVLLINMDIQKLFELFPDEIFDTIYLNFSDPWPKKRQHKRRLTYPTYLDRYYRIIKNGGKIIFKTDNDGLFVDSVEYFNNSKFTVIKCEEDYATLDEDDVMTEYEEKFRNLGVKIKRLIAMKG